MIIHEHHNSIRSVKTIKLLIDLIKKYDIRYDNPKNSPIKGSHSKKQNQKNNKPAVSLVSSSLNSSIKSSNGEESNCHPLLSSVGSVASVSSEYSTRMSYQGHQHPKSSHHILQNEEMFIKSKKKKRGKE